MKRVIILTLVLACSVLTNTFGQMCTLNGTITGFKQKSFILMYGADGKPGLKRDTVYVNNDKFTWSGKIARSKSAVMVFDGAEFNIFLDPAEITVIGRADSLSQLKVAGSKTHDEMVAFNTRSKPWSEKIKAIDDKLFDNAVQDRQSLKKQIGQLKDELYSMRLQHISTHPNSSFSQQLVMIITYDESYKKASEAYRLFDKSILENDVNDYFIKRLTILKRSEVGEPLLNFAQNDAEGKPVKFSDFKGKYVLIDFWASWCGPCRAENPNVLSMYNKFKDKGFTVIGVSLDSKKEDWINAVKDDKMPWTQVSDLKGWKNELASYYGISGIPDNFLVGPDGKIIAKYLRGQNLQEELAKLF